jgi:hypothetical protein
MPDTNTAVPAKAGIHREVAWMAEAWLRLRRALLQGLYLMDPWVPAFAGTTAVDLKEH